MSSGAVVIAGVLKEPTIVMIGDAPARDPFKYPYVVDDDLDVVMVPHKWLADVAAAAPANTRLLVFDTEGYGRMNGDNYDSTTPYEVTQLQALLPVGAVTYFPPDGEDYWSSHTDDDGNPNDPAHLEWFLSNIEATDPTCIVWMVDGTGSMEWFWVDWDNQLPAFRSYLIAGVDRFPDATHAVVIYGDRSGNYNDDHADWYVLMPITDDLDAVKAAILNPNEPELNGQDTPEEWLRALYEMFLNVIPVDGRHGMAGQTTFRPSPSILGEGGDIGGIEGGGDPSLIAVLGQ